MVIKVGVQLLGVSAVFVDAQAPSQQIELLLFGGQREVCVVVDIQVRDDLEAVALVDEKPLSFRGIHHLLGVFANECVEEGVKAPLGFVLRTQNTTCIRLRSDEACVRVSR